MDEIFDRLKSVKLRKKHLIFPLIFAEILGILVLVWFLRVPLYQKYLKAEPKNYSVDSLNPDKQYLLKQGDFITGKSDLRLLQVWLAPNGSKHGLIPNDRDEFVFQIPPDTKPGSYQFIIAGDNFGKIEVVKTLKIRVESNNKLKLKQLFF